MIWSRAHKKKPSQREMMAPFSLFKAPNNDEFRNQGTPPSKPIKWNKCTKFDKRGPPKVEEMIITQQGHEGYSNVIDKLALGMVMDGTYK